MAAALQVFRDSIIERHRAQAELAHVNRVATMGQFTASIAHEVNQPIGAVVTNAETALRWLGANRPDLDEAQQALARIAGNGIRASDVIGRIRALVKKVPQHKARFDLNQAILEVISLDPQRVLRHGVSLDSSWQRLAAPSRRSRPAATGGPQPDHQRCRGHEQRRRGVARTLDHHRRPHGPGARGRADSGPGPGSADAVHRLFEAFYTTKPDGMGMGLAICRSIIEAHAGQMWAISNEPRGAVFQFTLSAERD